MFYKIFLSLLLLGFIVNDAAPLTNNNILKTNEKPFKDKQNLVYSIFHNSSGLPTSDLQKVIKKAFDTWSAVIPLTFTEDKPKNKNVDIQVKFFPRDVGPELGFQSYYENGASYIGISFQTDFKWKIYSSGEKYNSEMPDIYLRALKLVGATLRLKENEDSKSIMQAWPKVTLDSNGNYVEPKLSHEDIKTAQEMYGKKKIKQCL
uniref:Peptidase M10 metallopeptidase domain-containing protein n=1 Tax=Panagrolaimus sp. PS1159 TaxID=55785 RepID=A0AC35FXM0_9BILA